MDEVTLTSDEAEALEDYLWGSLIPYIQNTETEVDNLEWVRLMCTIWAKCKDLMDEKKKKEKKRIEKRDDDGRSD